MGDGTNLIASSASVITPPAIAPAGLSITAPYNSSTAWPASYTVGCSTVQWVITGVIGLMEPTLRMQFLAIAHLAAPLLLGTPP